MAQEKNFKSEDVEQNRIKIMKYVRIAKIFTKKS